MDFGRLAGLQGYFLTQENLDTRLSRPGLTDTTGAGIQDQKYDLGSCGADLTISLSEA